MKGGSSHIFRGGVFHFGTGWKGLGWWYPPPPTLQHHNFNGDTREPGFRDGKGQQAISEKRRRGCAVFNYEAASGKFTADPAPSDCGKVCHVKVKAIGMGHRQRATKPSHSGYYTRSDKLQPSFLMNGGYE